MHLRSSYFIKAAIFSRGYSWRTSHLENPALILLPSCSMRSDGSNKRHSNESSQVFAGDLISKKSFPKILEYSQSKTKILSYWNSIIQ